MYWIYGITFALGLIWLGYYAWMTSRTQVPSMVLDRRSIQRLQEYLSQDNILKGKTFYELGSAFGQMCFVAESLGAKTIQGFELSPVHVWVSSAIARIRGSQAVFIRQDFFKADLSQADVLYMWLVPKIANRVWEKIRQECQPGTVVIVFGTPLSGVTPQKQIPVDPKDLQGLKFSVYQV